MATGIEVVLSGLMLICLYGTTICPGNYDPNFPNTAWAVKADGPTTACGWSSAETTTLAISFKPEDFYPVDIECDTTTEDKATKIKTCTITRSTICIDPNQSGDQTVSDLKKLPSLNEIDRRFLSIKPETLADKSYVSTVIRFKKGKISPGEFWETVGNRPVKWYRTNHKNEDKYFPRPLSDELRISYPDASELTITDCTSKIATFKPRLSGARLRLQNMTKYGPVPDHGNDGESSSLAYLLWYYQFGEWDTYSGECPKYNRRSKDAVLLTCYSRTGTDCTYNKNAQATTRYWPPMLMPPPDQREAPSN